MSQGIWGQQAVKLPMMVRLNGTKYQESRQESGSKDNLKTKTAWKIGPQIFMVPSHIRLSFKCDSKGGGT